MWKEIPFAFLGVALIFLFGNDTLLEGRGFNEISRSDGIALISLFILFMYYVGTQYERKNESTENEEIKIYSTPVSLSFILAGLVGLFLGGQLFVSQSVIIAQLLDFRKRLSD